MSKHDELYYLHCVALKLPQPKREYRFHNKRRWRFDFAWPEKKVAVEIEGGIWHGGRHTRGRGFQADCEKYNAASEDGWTVFRFTPKQVKSGEAVGQMERILIDDSL